MSKKEDTAIPKDVRTLGGIELLGEASPDIISRLEKECRWFTCEPDEVIVDRDDESTEVFFITSGSVKVMDFLANDQEIALAELGAGTSFGEMSAIDSSRRSARVAALEDTTLAALPSKMFRQLLID